MLWGRNLGGLCAVAFMGLLPGSLPDSVGESAPGTRKGPPPPTAPRATTCRLTPCLACTLITPSSGGRVAFLKCSGTEWRCWVWGPCVARESGGLSARPHDAVYICMGAPQLSG